MTYQPITPFRRTVDAAVLKHQSFANTQDGPERINKWEVLRELTVARGAFGLSDRELSVLRALLSFYQPVDLVAGAAEMIVFPSNAALCDRLNGMPCSTMRRHLSGLVRAGVILRRDSPNGKRYRRRSEGEHKAFGFDLMPLMSRLQSIVAAAEAAREEQEAYKRARETVSLMRRDLAGLVVFGQQTRPELSIWDRYDDLARLTGRALRRVLSMDEMDEMRQELLEALNRIRDLFDVAVTEEVSTSGVNNEQHYQNSNKDTYVSEPCLEKAGDEVADDLDDAPEVRGAGELPTIPLTLVLACCKEILTYGDGPVRHWHDLVRAVDRVRPMMGISPTAWDEAKARMGPEQAAVVVAAMLERFDDIKSPGGYLRHLARRAGEGAFSCGPMVMALMRRSE